MEKSPDKILGLNMFVAVGPLIFTSNCFSDGRFSVFQADMPAELLLGLTMLIGLSVKQGAEVPLLSSSSCTPPLQACLAALLQLSFFESSIFNTCCASSVVCQSVTELGPSNSELVLAVHWVLGLQSRIPQPPSLCLLCYNELQEFWCSTEWLGGEEAVNLQKENGKSEASAAQINTSAVGGGSSFGSYGQISLVSVSVFPQLSSLL